MAEKMPHYSTRPGMTRSSSHLTSVYDNDPLELVRGNGPILVQGLGGGSTSSTRKTPSCNIGYSINPLSGEEGNDHEDDRVTKGARLSASRSLLHIPAHSLRHSDMDSSLNPNSHQSNDQDSSCQLDLLQFCKSKSLSKLQDGCANLRQVKESPESMLTGGAHARQPATTGNGCLCTYSPQQCLLGMEYSSQTPATISQKQDFVFDQRPEKVNFSNLLRPAVSLKSSYKGNSATLPTNNTVLTRVEEIKAGKVEKTKTAAAATSSKAPDHSVVIDSAKGSHGLLQEKRALIAWESKPVSLVARSHDQEPLRDEHSEAVGHNGALSFHRSQDQHYNQTSSSAGLGVRAKGKADANFCNEPLLASSSVCSLGASNDPNLCSRKHEDTDDSTYLSDNEEEPGDLVKETPAREGTRVKRSRNTEIHNLYERKRRDKINKKMRVLKELIPNCNKMDKASMLDDAIEYLKTLKLQLQIMSMGAGLCMPLMMLPAGPHHISTPHLHQLMGAGMGFRPGSTGIPCSLPQFPIPTLPGITDNRLQMFGFPNQVPPMPISHAPFIPMIGNPSAQPLPANSTATNPAKHRPSEQLTTQAERATKQAPNQGTN